MQNYKGSISLLRRSVGFSVGVDWMKCGWGGASLEETAIGFVPKTMTITDECWDGLGS